MAKVFFRFFIWWSDGIRGTSDICQMPFKIKKRWKWYLLFIKLIATLITIEFFNFLLNSLYMYFQIKSFCKIFATLITIDFFIFSWTAAMCSYNPKFCVNVLNLNWIVFLFMNSLYVEGFSKIFATFITFEFKVFWTICMCTFKSHPLPKFLPLRSQ